MEKLFEEHLKHHLLLFLDKHDILDKHHHGGRAYHSPQTAQTLINHEIIKQYENDRIVAVLTTDLSSALDTINHDILIQKLEHYAIRGKELELLKSYLKDRKAYVEIETYKSTVLECPRSSVFQG